MTRLSLCNQSSFCADSVMVTIVPSFTSSKRFDLLSSTQKAKVGPFIAGMPINVPLWIAKTLKRRNFAEIEPPEWLSVAVLTSILKEERESTLLSRRLPFHYYEIARALDCCLTDNNNSVANSGVGGGGKATKVVLQDLVAVRSDKLRMHFHELSRSDLVHPPPGYDDVDEDGNYIDSSSSSSQGDGSGSRGELPIISVTGICSYELNKVGPFLQRAFSDYGFLTRRSSTSTSNNNSTSTKKVGSNSSKGVRPEGNENSYDKENSTATNSSNDYNGDDNDDVGGAIDKTTRRVSVARSRLRRFRS